MKDEADLEAAQNSCCVISKKARLTLRRTDEGWGQGEEEEEEDSLIALPLQGSSFISQNVHFAKCNEQSKHNKVIKVV